MTVRLKSCDGAPRAFRLPAHQPAGFGAAGAFAGAGGPPGGGAMAVAGFDAGPDAAGSSFSNSSSGTAPPTRRPSTRNEVGVPLMFSLSPSLASSPIGSLLQLAGAA